MTTPDAPALGPLLGSGKVAEVFAYGDLAAKLYRSRDAKESAFREAAALAHAEARGLPVPPVHAVREIAGRWGVVMGRVEGPSLAEAVRGGPDETAAALDTMVRLQLRVHEQPGGRLGNLKARLRANIDAAARLGDARRRRLLDRLAALPYGDRLCHGDFHPWNIMGPPGRERIVDWLDASAGEPAADVCRSYVLIAPHLPDFANAHVDRYAAASGLSRAAILAWLPCVAAARIAENVPDEEDGLMAMAEGA
jgi:aminoglycoside phosphotransferase (APT) family kinase protein